MTKALFNSAGNIVTTLNDDDESTHNVPPGFEIREMVQADLDAIAVAQIETLPQRKERATAQVYADYRAKWIELHGSVETALEHAMLWIEANGILNDTHAPISSRPTGASRPFVDEHILEFGGIEADVAAAIITAEKTDVVRIAKAARHRKRALADISEAVDIATVDTAIQTWVTSLGAV